MLKQIFSMLTNNLFVMEFPTKNFKDLSEEMITDELSEEQQRNSKEIEEYYVQTIEDIIREKEKNLRKILKKKSLSQNLENDKSEK